MGFFFFALERVLDWNGRYLRCIQAHSAVASLESDEGSSYDKVFIMPGVAFRVEGAAIVRTGLWQPTRWKVINFFFAFRLEATLWD